MRPTVKAMIASSGPFEYKYGWMLMHFSKISTYALWYGETAMWPSGLARVGNEMLAPTMVESRPSSPEIIELVNSKGFANAMHETGEAIAKAMANAKKQMYCSHTIDGLKAEAAESGVDIDSLQVIEIDQWDDDKIE